MERMRAKVSFEAWLRRVVAWLDEHPQVVRYHVFGCGLGARRSALLVVAIARRKPPFETRVEVDEEDTR